MPICRKILTSCTINALLIFLLGIPFTLFGFAAVVQGMPKAIGGIACGCALVILGIRHYRLAPLLAQVSVKTHGVQDYLCCQWIAFMMVMPWIVVVLCYSVWRGFRAESLEQVGHANSETVLAAWDAHMRVQSYGAFVLCAGFVALGITVLIIARYFTTLSRLRA